MTKGADDDTIKVAYRDLVHRYHSDRYVNHPLSGFATEKMKEINDAYDRITNQAASGNKSTGKIIFGAGGHAEHFELTRREKERRDRESLAKWVSAYEKYREDEYLEEKRRKTEAETLAKYIKILLALHE